MSMGMATLSFNSNPGSDPSSDPSPVFSLGVSCSISYVSLL